jgi:hypothetical protein
MSAAAVRATGSARPGSPFFLGGTPVPPRQLELQSALNIVEKKARRPHRGSFGS